MFVLVQDKHGQAVAKLDHHIANMSAVHVNQCSGPAFTCLFLNRLSDAERCAPVDRKVLRLRALKRAKTQVTLVIC